MGGCEVRGWVLTFFESEIRCCRQMLDQPSTVVVVAKSKIQTNEVVLLCGRRRCCRRSCMVIRHVLLTGCQGNYFLCSCPDVQSPTCQVGNLSSHQALKLRFQGVLHQACKPSSPAINLPASLLLNGQRLTQACCSELRLAL